jgi:hypothetical protein
VVVSLAGLNGAPTTNGATADFSRITARWASVRRAPTPASWQRAKGLAHVVTSSFRLLLVIPWNLMATPIAKFGPTTCSSEPNTGIELQLADV